MKRPSPVGGGLFHIGSGIVMGATSKTMEPIHPGEILREEFLGRLRVSANHLARERPVPATRATALGC
jgi:hypothetical protein